MTKWAGDEEIRWDELRASLLQAVPLYYSYLVVAVAALERLDEDQPASLRPTLRRAAKLLIASLPPDAHTVSAATQPDPAKFSALRDRFDGYVEKAVADPDAVKRGSHAARAMIDPADGYNIDAHCWSCGKRTPGVKKVLGFPLCAECASGS